ncbi:MAG TPA: GGDEF domain-containing response regulator [Tepidisphaeraceae bacterium]|nr:GGDEF domain-containing response regulator [Tepidisphaeraceae bacterium]
MPSRTVEALRLLIIEDDQDQRDLIREVVEERFGAGTVVGVDSRKDAVAQDLASFDLILCDYNLPDANGLELLAEIRGRCSTPVIMVTGENVGHIAASAIRAGATDYVVKFGDYLFTIPLVIEKNLAVAKIIKEKEDLRRQLEESNAQLEQMAATDPLTGLYNRRHFGRVIEQLFAETQRYGNDLSCVMIDLDGYKQLNDSYGHQVGDQLLVMAGKVIAANMRRMDVAARYGGDEFVLLIPHAMGADAAQAAERIRSEYRQASGALLQKGHGGVSMSIGVASARCVGASSSEQLLARADAALYQSKEAGRNRITVAQPVLFAETQAATNPSAAAGSHTRSAPAA